jgi:hypothetical protein
MLSPHWVVQIQLEVRIECRSKSSPSLRKARSQHLWLLFLLFRSRRPVVPRPHFVASAPGSFDFCFSRVLANILAAEQMKKLWTRTDMGVYFRQRNGQCRKQPASHRKRPLPNRQDPNAEPTTPLFHVDRQECALGLEPTASLSTRPVATTATASFLSPFRVLIPRSWRQSHRSLWTPRLCPVE